MKKAIEKGNIDGAKIYAQNAIRKKTEALNYLRLASRLDAVVSRLDTQAKMNMINSSMSQIVRALDKVISPAQKLPPSHPTLCMPVLAFLAVLMRFNHSTAVLRRDAYSEQHAI